MAIHLHHVRTLVIRDLPPGEVCMAFDPGPQSEEGATHPELLSSLEAIVFLPGDRSDFQDRRLRPGGQFAPRKDQTVWESLICGVERMIPGDRQIHLCYSKTWSHPSALEFDDPNPIPILTKTFLHTRCAWILFGHSESPVSPSTTLRLITPYRDVLRSSQVAASSTRGHHLGRRSERRNREGGAKATIAVHRTGDHDTLGTSWTDRRQNHSPDQPSSHRRWRGARRSQLYDRLVRWGSGPDVR